jgi:hypothetical protein
LILILLIAQAVKYHLPDKCEVRITTVKDQAGHRRV